MSRDDSDSPENDRPDEVLAAEYVLHLLDPAERSAAETRLGTDGAFRALVAEWSERLVPMAEEIPSETPPAGLRQRLAAETAPRAPKREPRFAAGRRRSFLVGLLGGAGLAAAVALAFMVATPLLGPEPGPRFAADVTSESEDLLVTASYDPDAAELTVTRAAGQAPEGQVLQLWLLTEDQPPHAVGVLPDDGSLSVPVIPFWGQRIPQGRFAVSIEPPGGSTDEVGPTGEILAVAEVTPR
ncbi:anti-sigma factor [Palleronia pelagia]|uniref:Regulator of SigK n=1 Tax=Palleronia pelagia TaxID=387096 RepID=A0A1H8K2Q1_9RHOB|nr:anti-sigma factor [Palleronia pelagia]SEN87222.1 Anti-sigma-K factor RskA [Palleronia pelagia]